MADAPVVEMTVEETQHEIDDQITQAEMYEDDKRLVWNGINSKIHNIA